VLQEARFDGHVLLFSCLSENSEMVGINILACMDGKADITVDEITYPSQNKDRAAETS
jgi:hypothetical protein